MTCAEVSTEEIIVANPYPGGIDFTFPITKIGSESSGSKVRATRYQPGR